MKGLTKKQAEVLKIVPDGLDRGLPPTVRELQGLIGSSAYHTNARSHLLALRAKGYLEWDPKTSRAFRVLKRPAAAKLVEVTPPTRCDCGAVRFGTRSCPMCAGGPVARGL